MRAAHRYAVGCVEQLGKHLATVFDLMPRVGAGAVVRVSLCERLRGDELQVCLLDRRREYAHVGIRCDVLRRMPHIDMYAVPLQPSRPWRGVEVASGYVATAFLQEECDACHTNAAYSGKMISLVSNHGA